MEHFGPFAVAIMFWIFVTVAAVAGIVSDYKKRRLALEPLRIAVERGQQLDPALIDRLMAPERDAGMSPMPLRVGGIITLSAGVGIVIPWHHWEQARFELMPTPVIARAP
mgnify:CR=1 FL=1